MFLTADCVSDEKREGTLGLLFLTDLRGYDVVLGKLSTRSLQAAYAFLAAFPVVSITFMLGGVGAGEFIRSILVLAVTALQSLSLGLLVSAFSRDATRAMTGTLLLQLGIHLGLPHLDGALCGMRGIAVVPITSFLSPTLAMSEAGAIRLGTYWTSISAVTASALLGLTIASWLLPRAWQDQSGDARGKKAAGRIRRRPLLSRDPAAWLASRRVWLTRIVWGLFLVTGLYLGWELYRIQQAPPPTPGAMVPVRQGPTLVPIVVMLLFRLWVVIEAARFWIEAKSNGALELLLSTPLRLPEVIAGQWRSLIRRFVAPLVLLAALVGAGMWLTHLAQEKYLRALWTQASPGMTPEMIETSLAAMRRDSIERLLLNAISTLTSMLALARFAVWMAMTSRRLHVAALKAILFVDLLPAMAFGLLELITHLWLNQWLASNGLDHSIQTVGMGVGAIALDVSLAVLAFRRASRRAVSFATDGAER